MLKLREGMEMLAEIGGIKSINEARALFEEKIDPENLKKLEKIKNEEVLLKIANAISMGAPDAVFVNTGSPEDKNFVRRLAVEKGEESPLAMKDHTIHYDLAKEQARVIDRTYYIVNEGEPTNALARKLPRREAHEYVKKTLGGLMKGMTLVVGFYCRGPVGAKATVPALEITTSAYVSHSADILYRHCYENFDEEIERRGYFFTNVHSEGPNRDEDLRCERW